MSKNETPETTLRMAWNDPANPDFFTCKYYRVDAAHQALLNRIADVSRRAAKAAETGTKIALDHTPYGAKYTYEELRLIRSGMVEAIRFVPDRFGSHHVFPEYLTIALSGGFDPKSGIRKEFRAHKKLTECPKCHKKSLEYRQEPWADVTECWNAECTYDGSRYSIGD